MLETALDWLNKGIAPIPIRYKDKKPLIKWERYQTQLPDDWQVRSWFSNGPCNLGIICGWQNLVVIDFDNLQAYNDWQLETTLPLTYSVSTSRGVHLYFYVTNLPQKSQKLPGIDIKVNGYILTPPSIHPTGLTYVTFDPRIPILNVENVSDIITLPTLLHTQWNGKSRQDLDPWYNVDLIGAIKVRFDILDMVEVIKQSGRGWFVALCPFHQDHNPSFWIDSNKGICGCYSGCTQQPLDVIDLYARLQGISNEDAIHKMGQEIGWYDEWA